MSILFERLSLGKLQLKNRIIIAPTGTRNLQWSPHAHRRTFATVAMEAGVLEEIVGRLLNHTPMSITGQRYVRPSLDALRPSVEIACGEILSRMGK